MIPKIIHYCWFGGNPLPESAKNCIASWRKFFPDYEIIEWNESNFDVYSIPYTAEAYSAKKYAFVSDYVRIKVLYEHGGVYFDTDVEVIAPLTDILDRGGYMGFEIDPCAERLYGAVNPGLGMAAPLGNAILKQILDYYNHLQFILDDGTYNISDAIVNITTRVLIANGLQEIAGIQLVENLYLYPAEYFNPLDDAIGRLHCTSKTYSIHWFSKTWMHRPRWQQWCSRYMHRVLGVATITRLKTKFK